MNRSPENEARMQAEGVRVKFTNPELLRAYILDPEAFRGISLSLAERMSQIREVPLGEFLLDGGLFKSARFTLIIEANPREGGRPTVIIRADLTLGDADSAIKRFQLTKASKQSFSRGDEKDEDERAKDWKANPFSRLDSTLREGGDAEVLFTPYSNNTARFSPGSVETQADAETAPMVILQQWDKDAGPGSISISLLSYARYTNDWRERFDQLSEEEKRGWETNIDKVDSWRFHQRVGVSVSREEEFKQAIQFFEEAFAKALSAIYTSEGVSVPRLNCKIDSPVILRDEKVIAFGDIGGQDNVVKRLRALAAMEKASVKLGEQGRCVLLAGPPGNGKSSLVQAFAAELGAPLVTKTTRDLPRRVTDEEVISLVESGYLEAKSKARARGRKAVYCLEGVEAFLTTDRLHDFLLNTMDVWEGDEEVIFVGTSNFPEQLHPGITSRFVAIPVAQLDREGRRKVLEIHMRKIVELLGRNVFGDVDFNEVAARLENFSGRSIMQFLAGAYSLRRLASQTDLQFAPIDTSFLLNLLPERQRPGFKT